jgi:hypothetical protein
MADKEMIAAMLAAGVLAAAPPVLDPLAAAKEAASLYFEVRDAKPGLATPSRRFGATRILPANLCSAELQIAVPSSVRMFRAAVFEC